MTSTTAARPPYEVQLVQCPALSADLRAAAELRFRMALEFALGGPGNVLLTLQAYMLTQALNSNAESEEPADLRPENDAPARSVDEDEDDGAQPLITLWEKAESDAIAAAFKPLGAHFRHQVAEARFEITLR